MEISIKKTFIQPFCFSRRFNFTPELFYDGEQLDVVYTAKLLGVHFSSDLRWNTHISEMSKKANSKLFFIRRLKDLRASQSTLVEIYKLFIRQGLEFEVPLYGHNLFQKNVVMFDIRLSSFLGVQKIHLGHFSIAFPMQILKIFKFLICGEIWTKILAKY